MNKILFIYDYGEETWSTPYSLMKEFSKRGWEVNRLTFEGVELARSLPAYDIVLVMDWQGKDISKECKSQFLKQDVFLVKELGDTPQNFSNHLKADLESYDWMFTPDYTSAYKYMYDYGFNCSWINHWADTAIQFPKDVPIEYTAVTTRGKGNSQILDIITDWGDGTIGNRNNLDGIAHTDFLNSGLMVIQNSRWGEITRRIFEGMACGKLVITDRLHSDTKLGSLFIENQDIVFYNDVNDFADKINYYAEHSEEREAIAKSGMNKVLKHFTQVNVVNQIIEQWENFL